MKTFLSALLFLTEIKAISEESNLDLEAANRFLGVDGTCTKLIDWEDLTYCQGSDDGYRWRKQNFLGVAADRILGNEAEKFKLQSQYQTVLDTNSEFTEINAEGDSI